MFKLANESNNLKQEFSDILININLFDFEDRKHLQQFISELYNQFTEILEETLDF
jgi:hypothetical protein